MTVRAVTPRITAIGGHMQFYRDADHFDAAQDLLATGEDIFSSEWPDKPLRLKPTRGGHVRPARSPRRGHAPMNALTGHTAGLDGRPVSATSSTSVASPITPLAADPACGDITPDPQRHAAPGSLSSSNPGAAAELEDVRRPGGHRDAS